jgi:hypothetical protein
MGRKKNEEDMEKYQNYGLQEGEYFNKSMGVKDYLNK